MKNKFLIFTIFAILITGSILLFKGCTSEDKDKITLVDNTNLEFFDNNLIKEAGGSIKDKPDYISKGANIINAAKNYSVCASDVSKIINKTYENDEKMIFLTFDDGPSEGTKQVLDILDSENVNATFFILGNVVAAEQSLAIVKDVISRGNAIANHTYSHNYKILYPGNSVNVSSFMQEVERTNNTLKSVLGENFSTKVVRMPGGYMSRKYYNDKNLESLNIALKDKGLVQIDWTSENGDGLTVNESIEEMIQRVKSQTEYQNQVVLLMHDALGKDKTIQALPEIIKYFKDNGYNFKVIANDNIG